MSPKRHSQRMWIVRWTFEPNRLAPATLAQAYEQVVPQSIRVLRVPSDKVEPQGEADQAQKARRLQ